MDPPEGYVRNFRWNIISLSKLVFKKQTVPPNKHTIHNPLVGGWTTHLKNISQIGNHPQVGVKVKTIWNHQLDPNLVGGIIFS